MLKGLKDKTVLVTGAGGGIGRAACRRFIEEGSRVIAAVHHENRELASELGANGACVMMDVTEPESVAQAISQGAERFGSLDLAFLNAGVETNSATIANFSRAEYERVFNVNVLGEFLSAQGVVNHMLAAGKAGGILFMASIAGLQGYAYTSVYNASKWAVIGIAKSLAHEVAANGIRVNVICPGMVETRMAHSIEDSMALAAGIDPASVKSNVVGQTELGRYATAEEVAAMAAWILSDEVPYCHGETFTLGGGSRA